MPMTETNKKDKDIILKKISCIYYLFWFYKENKKKEVYALINLNCKINILNPTYIANLGLTICQTNIKAKKINNFIFEMFSMVLAEF